MVSEEGLFRQNLKTDILLIMVKTIESVVVVDLDENNKITYLADQWGGNEMPSWFGASFLRIVNAKTAPWLFHVPKLST